MRSPDDTAQPTLADLGLTKRESVEAQAELESDETKRDRAKLAVDAREIKARIACVECVQGVEAGRAVSYPYSPSVRARTRLAVCTIKDLEE